LISAPNKTQFFTGLRKAIPITVAAATFGLLFGTTAINSGLTLFETLLASVTIFAASSQFVFLELSGYKAPAWSIVLAVFAVSFRHVLYSAALGRHMGDFSVIQKSLAFFLLVDPVYGEAEQRAQLEPLRRSFYFGYALTMYVGWILSTLVGALFGALITNPQAFGLDLVLPIYFACLVVGFKDRPNWLPVVLASGTGSAVFYFLIGPPWHISLGALIGIVVAVLLVKPDSGTAENSNGHG